MISWVYSVLAKGLGSSQVVFQHIGRKPKFNGKGSIVKSSFRGEIEFKNVYFSYPCRPHQLVLNVSFRLFSAVCCNSQMTSNVVLFEQQLADQIM